MLARNFSRRNVSRKQNQFWVLAAFALFTFWENFVFGIRIFDFVGLAILIGLLVAGRTVVTAEVRKIGIALPFIMLNLYYAAIGAISGYNDSADLKAAVGFGLGILTFFICRSVSIDAGTFLRLINYLMLVHALCAILQFGFFYLNGGFILNLNPFVDTESLRVIDGAGFLRASGFFAEPASHALTLTLLFSLKSRIIERRNKMDAFNLISLVSMLISGSIWGCAATFVWLSYRRPIRTAVILSLIVGAIKFTPVIDTLQNVPVVNRLIVQRVEGLLVGEDGSLEGRYTSSSDIYQFDLSQPETLIGNGVQSGKGMNSIVRHLHSHGLLGFLGFLVFACLMTPKPERIRFLFWILFMLTAAGSLPFFFIWWAWLGFYSAIPSYGSPKQLPHRSSESMNLSFAR